MVEEISGDVCWIHIFEHGLEIKVNKYFFKPEDYSALPVVYLDENELDNFPILRCNRVYITTSDAEYHGRKKYFRFLRRVVSKIEKNWVGRKISFAPIFVPPEKTEEMKKRPTIIKRYERYL